MRMWKCIIIAIGKEKRGAELCCCKNNKNWANFSLECSFSYICNFFFPILPLFRQSLKFSCTVSFMNYRFQIVCKSFFYFHLKIRIGPAFWLWLNFDIFFIFMFHFNSVNYAQRFCFNFFEFAFIYLSHKLGICVCGGVPLQQIIVLFLVFPTIILYMITCERIFIFAHEFAKRQLLRRKERKTTRKI